MNIYTCPRLTFLKKNATENAYKSISEPLNFQIFWGSMPPHPPSSSRLLRSKLASSCSEVWVRPWKVIWKENLHVCCGTDQDFLDNNFFPGSILNAKHGCHRAGNGQGKKFLKVREKSGNFTSSQRKFQSLKEVREKWSFKSEYILYNLWTWIMLYCSWNWRTSWRWVFKKIDPFCTLCYETINSCTLHVSCWKHKLILKWL